MLACNREPPPAPRDAGVLLAVDAGRDAAGGDGGRRTAVPATRADEEAYDRFVDTLVAGRAALREKRLPDALAAFARAGEIEPWDPRPLFERGNALLAEKKYALALLDLESTRERANNPGFATQILFDVGLARESLGDAEGARAMFLAVQRVRPSEMAATRLVHRSSCEAAVDRRRVPGVTARGWLALWRALAADYLRDHAPLTLPPAATEAEARAALCGAGCDGAGPWTVTMGGAEALLSVVAARGADLVAFPRVARSLGGECPSSDAVSIDASASPARVRVRRDAVERVYFKKNDLGAELACDGSLKDCAWRCEPEGWMQADWFFDLAAGARVLRVEQVGRAEQGREPLVAVSVRGRTVQVRGSGCNEDVGL